MLIKPNQEQVIKDQNSLRMIKDAEKGNFDYVIVYKLDRFSRNKYDSAMYKRKLKQCGVRVISVTEQSDDSPESVILESVIEGMEEYYSKNLARETMNGLTENGYKALHNVGTPQLGVCIFLLGCALFSRNNLHKK